MGDALPRLDAADVGAQGLTSSQTAQYTHDLLDSLMKIAARQQQDMLAKLLEVAAIEASRIAEHETSLLG